MTRTTPVTPDIDCAEAIAFMHLLHAVPTKPFINPLQQQAQTDPSAYSLPFDRERDFVTTLAFLSNIGEDPNHVPALCMHQKPEMGESDVIIAVNQARHGDGLSTLKDIREGFEGIFYLLSRVLQSEEALSFRRRCLPSNCAIASDAEEAIFRNIVAMCSLRIRERLRFAVHKTKKPKQTIKRLLEDISTSLDGKYSDFRGDAKAVVKIIDMWLKHQTEQRLCDIVEAVYQLSCNSSLSQIFSSVPNTRMGSSERRNLLKMVRRVARYRDAARFLYRTAKKYSIVRAMQIVLISLPRYAFRSLSIEHEPDFLATCARLQIAHGSQANVARVARLLGREEQTAEQSFSHQCTKTLREGKIHAEIQLAYYFETYRPKPAPRVVASSKMACFLCNIFLCQAAKVYTKRCHGRLYPGWKLPVFPSQCGLERLFVQSLEAFIRDSAATLLLRQRRTFFPQPSESTLWTMDLSATTLSTINVPEDILEEPPSPELSIHSSRGSLATQAEIGSMFEAAPDGQTDSSINGAPLLEKLDLLTIRQGKMATLSVGASTIAPVQAGPLFVQLEYTVGKNGGVGPELGCSVEWLAQEDADAVKRDKNVYIVDAEFLNDEVAISGGNSEALYIATSGNLVKLEIMR